MLEIFLLDPTLDFSTSVWKSSYSEKYQENVHFHFKWSCMQPGTIMSINKGFPNLDLSFLLKTIQLFLLLLQSLKRWGWSMYTNFKHFDCIYAGKQFFCFMIWGLQLYGLFFSREVLFGLHFAEIIVLLFGFIWLCNFKLLLLSTFTFHFHCLDFDFSPAIQFFQEHFHVTTEEINQAVKCEQIRLA